MSNRLEQLMIFILFSHTYINWLLKIYLALLNILYALRRLLVLTITIALWSVTVIILATRYSNLINNKMEVPYRQGFTATSQYYTNILSNIDIILCYHVYNYSFALILTYP